jgi:Na+-transporting methylmalonyl-CoA/oxaloacetate decarboxylase gamma subunit
MLPVTDWDLVIKVCIYGQVAVFVVLTTLMLSMYATSSVVRYLLRSDKKSECNI